MNRTPEEAAALAAWKGKKTKAPKTHDPTRHPAEEDPTNSSMHPADLLEHMAATHPEREGTPARERLKRDVRTRFPERFAEIYPEGTDA